MPAIDRIQPAQRSFSIGGFFKNVRAQRNRLATVAPQIQRTYESLSPVGRSRLLFLCANERHARREAVTEARAKRHERIGDAGAFVAAAVGVGGALMGDLSVSVLAAGAGALGIAQSSWAKHQAERQSAQSARLHTREATFARRLKPGRTLSGEDLQVLSEMWLGQSAYCASGRDAIEHIASEDRAMPDVSDEPRRRAAPMLAG